MRWVALVLTALPPAAHDEKLSSSLLEVLENRVVWRVDVGVPALERVGVEFPAAPVDLSEEHLREREPEIVRYLKSCIALEIDGVPVEPEAGELSPVYEPFLATGEPYIARVRQEFIFHAPGGIRRVKASLAFFATATRSHRALVSVRWNDRARDYVRVGPAELEFTYLRLDPPFWLVAADFVGWGMKHIFIGYDHIAFLLALLLAARRAGEMIKIVTSFTVAHSLTLLLAAFEVVRVPPKVTEALIAASVAYVAAENFFLREARHRWVLTFAFGLVHGLGFSSVLRDHLEDASGILLPVVAFNVGVELGQVAILLAAFPLLRWARGREERRHRNLLVAGSSAVLALGLAFLVERIFDVGLVSPWLESLSG
ncbi:MAG: HupE/UreJ family protein [Planctomycetota bacterium]